jgi:hypothetical protein
MIYLFEDLAQLRVHRFYRPAFGTLVITDNYLTGVIKHNYITAGRTNVNAYIELAHTAQWLWAVLLRPI